MRVNYGKGNVKKSLHRRNKCPKMLFLYFFIILYSCWLNVSAIRAVTSELHSAEVIHVFTVLLLFCHIKLQCTV